MILRKLSLEFSKDFEGKNFAIMESKLLVNSEDENVKWEKLEVYIKKFQDPKEVDKLEKLKGELEEVEKIVHKNMDDLLKRGEDLDKLMEKSKDVSNLSLDFYKNAKKTNKRCCSLY
jgi:synaptobrevin family protein YKT6